MDEETMKMERFARKNKVDVRGRITGHDGIWNDWEFTLKRQESHQKPVKFKMKFGRDWRPSSDAHVLSHLQNDAQEVEDVSKRGFIRNHGVDEESDREMAKVYDTYKKESVKLKKILGKGAYDEFIHLF